jgi:hypothetical protein
VAAKFERAGANKREKHRPKNAYRGRCAKQLIRVRISPLVIRQFSDVARDASSFVNGEYIGDVGISDEGD